MIDVRILLLIVSVSVLYAIEVRLLLLTISSDGVAICA